MIRLMVPFSIALVLAPGPASAGSQDDAKVAVHATAHAVKGGGCADPALATTPCSQYTTEWTLGNTADIYLVVARADPAAGIAGLSCGVDYSAAQLFVSWTLCADGLHFPSDGGHGPWPAPGGGNRITWATCQDGVIGDDGVHAVAGFFYVYSYGEDRFQITPNNVIDPPELQVTACDGDPSDLPGSALGSVWVGEGQLGVNPCGSSSPVTQSHALSDIPVSGTVSGSYLDTHAPDDVREVVTERESGGKKSDRTSFAEHRWSFEVAAGTSVAFSVEASRTDNPDGDDFRFEYSTDGSSFVPLLTVNAASEQTYTGQLPPSTSGTVLVRVVDTDAIAGNRSLDSVSIDHMVIETTTTPPSGPPTADFSASPTGGPAPLTVSFTDLSTGDPASWSWDFGDGGTSSQQHPTHTYADPGTFTVSLTATNSLGSDTRAVPGYITVSPPSGPVMHVENITVTRYPDRNKWFARAEVTVADGSGAPVAGATVSGSFNAPNPASRSGITGSDGVAAVTSQSTKNPPGNWCFLVTDVALEGAGYDPGANVWTERCENGTGSAIGPEPSASPAAGEMRAAASARPNPLRHATEISFSLPAAERVTLEVFSVSGRRVAVLTDRVLGPGRHTVTWNASRDPAGLYLYRLTAGGATESHKLMLLR